MAGDFAVKIKLLNEFQCTENIVFFAYFQLILELYTLLTASI